MRLDSASGADQLLESLDSRRRATGQVGRVPVWLRGDLAHKVVESRNPSTPPARSSQVPEPRTWGREPQTAWQSVPGVVRGFVWLVILGSVAWFVLQFAAGWDLAKQADQAQFCAEHPTLCQYR